MPLLERQSFVSEQGAMPVTTVDDSSRVTVVSGETITLIVASTNVNSAGEAAGTVVYARITNSKILDSSRESLGHSKDTSFLFVTATILVTEVQFPWGVWEKHQFSTRALKAAAVGALLANGEFCINYRTGLILGKKNTTGDSDTAGYAYRAGIETIISGGGSAFVDDAAFTPGTTTVTNVGFLADETGTDSVDEGDAGAARMTLNRRQIMAGQTLDDAAFGVATEYANATGFLADETATDSVDEGDIGIARMTLARKQITASEFPEDSASASADYGTSVIGVRRDAPVSSTATEGDYSHATFDANGALFVTSATLTTGEDQTNDVLKVEGRFSFSATAVVDTQIKASAGFLHSITLSCNDSAPTAGTLIIYNNTAESGTILFKHEFTTTPFDPLTLIFDAVMSTGIYVGMATTGDVNFTCSFR